MAVALLPKQADPVLAAPRVDIWMQTAIFGLVVPLDTHEFVRLQVSGLPFSGAIILAHLS
jgi:hypothetical protein